MIGFDGKEIHYLKSLISEILVDFMATIHKLYHSK